jgi:hypothetical protein
MTMNQTEWTGVADRLMSKWPGVAGPRLDAYRVELGDLPKGAVLETIDLFSGRSGPPKARALGAMAADLGRDRAPETMQWGMGPPEPRPAGLPGYVPWAPTRTMSEANWRRQQRLVQQLWPHDAVPDRWARDALQANAEIAANSLAPGDVAQTIHRLHESGLPSFPGPEFLVRNALLAGAGGTRRRQEARRNRMLAGEPIDPETSWADERNEQSGNEVASALMSGREHLAPADVRQSGDPPWWLMIALAFFGGG